MEETKTLGYGLYGTFQGLVMVIGSTESQNLMIESVDKVKIMTQPREEKRLNRLTRVVIMFNNLVINSIHNNRNKR